MFIKTEFIKYLSTVIIFIIFAGCTANIDIKTKQAQKRLIVFGAFSQDTIRNYINISQSNDYFSQQPPTPISGASVTITSNNKTYTLKPDTVAGRYYIDSLNMITSREYHLDILLDFDQNGILEHYNASTIMPNTPRVDSIKLSDMVINKLPIMIVYGEIFHDTENNFALYNWKNNDTIGILDYLMIMPDKYLITQGDRYPTPYFVSKGIKKGDTLNMRIDNITNYYRRFLEQASSEVRAKNPFFSSPPSEVFSNIKCLNADIKVSGFFTAYSKGQVFSVISHIDYNFKR